MALSDVLSVAEDEVRLYLQKQPEVYNQKFNWLLLKYIAAVRTFYDAIPDGNEVVELKKTLTEIKDKLDIAIKEVE